MTDPQHIADTIAAALHDIRAAWDDMVPDIVSAALTGRVGGTRVAPTPIPIPIVSLRRETDAYLTSWAQLVIDERRLVTRPPPGVPGVAGFLLIHADWLGHHPAGQDAADELARHAVQCVDVAISRRVKRIPCGPCTQHGTSDLGERVPCTGKLSASIRTGDDGTCAITCTDDPHHSWAPWQWPALGYHISKIVA